MSGTVDLALPISVALHARRRYPARYRPAEEDLHAFQNVRNIKTWLKSYRIPKKSLIDDAFFGGMNLKEFF